MRSDAQETGISAEEKLNQLLECSDLFLTRIVRLGSDIEYTKPAFKELHQTFFDYMARILKKKGASATIELELKRDF